jgi:hypothetical protein
MSSTHLSTRSRRAAVAATAVLALRGVAACGETVEGDVSADQIEDISQDLGTLDDRVTALEESYQVIEPEQLLESEPGAGEDDPVFADPSAHVGEEVTVTAEVSELYDTTDAGAAFRISGDTGEQVAVITTDPPEELLANDVVEVTGTVRPVDEPEFEQNFGIALDELLNNTEGFLTDVEREAAIAADSVEVVESGSGG